jgi:diadenosine tetraphosphate (Ap4A) HIT family hydrolase
MPPYYDDRMGCPLCALSADRIVEEDTLTRTIRDGFPVSPGHTLVITRRHVSSIFEASDDERRALWAAVDRARSALANELRPDGWNLGVNDGPAGGQTVMHVHVHLIPRFAGDVRDARGGIRHCIPGKGYYDPDETPA